jgi:hypothetical protein
VLGDLRKFAGKSTTVGDDDGYGNSGCNAED